MPGIIDSHTHYDAQVTWDALCDPSPALGVTTVVMGNCGFTIAPCKPADRKLMMGPLTRVEGMAIEALEEGIQWNFKTFPEYLSMNEQPGVGRSEESRVRTWCVSTGRDRWGQQHKKKKQ